MRNSNASLPSVHAIRVFEVAVRQLGFTRAAEELGMTQAAVSYQIRLLEEAIGVPLFRRLPRKIALTPVGERLAPAVLDAFKTLRLAFSEVMERSETELAITALPTIAASWLVPRLGAFQLAHPELAVRLDASAEVVDFAEQAFDVGLRSGRGPWPGLEADLLMRELVTPVCSPALLARAKLRTPRDVLKHPLIGSIERWKMWLARAGVADAEPRQRAGLEFEVDQFEATAAMAGHGIALANPTLFRQELESGRLVAPFDITAGDGRDYWLVYPTARRHSSKIVAFRKWILGEAKASVSAPSRSSRGR
jgi:LysR family transcriptional regulator, glycine cleavage system transcriptional activator